MYKAQTLNRYSFIPLHIGTRWFWHSIAMISVISLLSLVYVKFSIKHSVMQRSVLQKAKNSALAKQDALLSEQAYLLSPAVLKHNAKVHAGMHLPTKRSIVKVAVSEKA